MKKLNESYMEVKKSKFIGLLYEVNSIDDVESILNELENDDKIIAKLKELTGKTIKEYGGYIG